MRRCVHAKAEEEKTTAGARKSARPESLEHTIKVTRDGTRILERTPRSTLFANCRLSVYRGSNSLVLTALLPTAHELAPT